VFVCDLRTSTTKRSKSELGCYATKKKYIFLYTKPGLHNRNKSWIYKGMCSSVWPEYLHVLIFCLKYKVMHKLKKKQNCKIHATDYGNHAAGYR